MNLRQGGEERKSEKKGRSGSVHFGGSGAATAKINNLNRLILAVAAPDPPKCEAIYYQSVTPPNHPGKLTSPQKAPDRKRKAKRVHSPLTP